MLNPATTPYKDAAPAPVAGALPEFSLLSCEGPDAAAFLQAQSMNDVRTLSPGQWQWNGWLNPKGRVICLFALWRRDAQDFVAILPDFPAGELQPLLQRFVFRSKLRLRALDELVVRGEFGAQGEGARELVREAGGAWRFDFGGDALARELVLLPRDSATAQDADTSAAWREADLAHGLPRLDPGQREAWTPQMLSLQRLRAYSLAKGCYPGQEIVARTHYLGQARRELVRLAGESLSPGQNICGPDGRALGTVVSAAADARSALAVLAAEREPGGVRAGDAPVSEAALLGGLQRPL